MKKYPYLLLTISLFILTLLITAINISPFIKISLNIITFLIYSIFSGSLLKNQCKNYIDKIKKLKGDLKKFNFEVQVTSSQISSVSESIAITLEENNSFAKSVFDEVKEMADNNQKVNTSIEKTLTEVKNIMDILNTAEEISVDMLQKSSLSKETVKLSLKEILQIVKTINDIHESSNMTLLNIEKLQSTSKEIIHILEAVRNVSKQTQLLALNANIEAARAGENGKGFAVVASEIHKLADDTGKSVESINSLILAIQTAVTSVHSFAVENSIRVNDGISATKNIETNLERIDTSFNDVFNMMDHISTLSKQEALIAHNVGEHIKEVEDIVYKNTKSVDDVYSSVHQQKHNIEDFSTMGLRLNEASSSLSELFSSEADNMDVISSEALEIAKSYLSLIHDELCSNVKITTSNESSVHEVVLSNFMHKYSFVEAAWTNDRKGRFICSIPKAGIANANVRDWFKQSINGQDFVSAVYISAITRNPCITVSAPIKNNDKIVGVIGIDVILK